MNKEQLQPLLAERKQWFRSPTCVNSEWYWAQYLLNEYALRRKQKPTYTTVSTRGGDMYDVWTIVKEYKPSQPTRLCIDPFPGMIVNGKDQLVRPLLFSPQFGRDFHLSLQDAFAARILGITVDSPTWYMEGMASLVERCVDHPLDIQDFRETMQTFQMKFKPKYK
jgi:hypothetical protein